MMNPCLIPGFGSGVYGKTPWGGSLEAIPGGPLPVVLPFDIYCVGPCGPISELLTHPEVSAIGDGTQFPIDGYTLDQIVRSGGTVTAAEAEIDIVTSVTEDFTLEFTVSFGNLPNDFTALSTNHIYIGASDAAGVCAALFFSKVGIIYTGCAHMSGPDIAFDTLLQPLPDSQLLVSENEYWTIRIAGSFITGTTYIYITKTADLLSVGHQLRYIVPAVRSSSALVVPPDRTLILVRGTGAQPSVVALNSICLASGLVIPNIPPVADPGIDRAVQLCEVLQLDATRSFDPEGGTLLYKWRLIDAPPPSQYTFIGGDGVTHPLMVPTGFADRFYSTELAVLDAADPIAVGAEGDVIVIAGRPHTLDSKGTDGDGFFVRVEGFVLADNLANTAFTLLRQRGLNTPTDAKPTFYPDVPGLFKFDLVVFDGGLFSSPESVVISVAESPVARGCTPDLSFIWGYLSDFWKLVEDRERVEVFWQGLAQAAAAELLNLWQVDYSKSLRDVQRTFQRRWLHYDLLMTQSTALLELTTVRSVLSGVESADVPSNGAGVMGTHLDLQLSTLSTPTVINIPTLVGVSPPYATTLQAYLQSALRQVDTRITVVVLENQAGSTHRVRIDAPFPFTVLPTTTAPIFTSGQKNEMPSGTAGVAVGVQSYRVERSLEGLDIKQNDFLCVDGVAYRINRVVNDPVDPLQFQRIILLDAIPASMGATWCISGTATSKDLDFWQGLCEQSDFVTFEVLELASQKLLEVESRVAGSSSALPNSLPCDATPVSFYLSQSSKYSVFLKSVKRRRFTPIDPLIVDVPHLQERIVAKDDTQVLRRNVDYFIDTFREQPCIRFVTPVPADAGGLDVWDGEEPPDRMWAETSYLDNRPRIEQNFGIPAEFTLDDLSQLPDTVDYLSCVRGLWYAYFNGPTLFNLHAGTQILLGLPFAEETGTITEVREDFSDTNGRILVQDLANPTITRSYTYPRALDLETNADTGKVYAVGDVVQQFAPLVTGVDVVDYVKDPTWFQGLLNQGAFFEPEKLFKFLVRVDSLAFNLSALLFVQTFVKRIKPTYTYPIFIVLAGTASAEVSVSDQVRYGGRLLLFEGAYFKPAAMGVSTMFDDPRASFGGWRAQYDHSNDPNNPVTSPTPEFPITWGYDKNFLAPEDAIVAQWSEVHAAPFAPQVDMSFLAVDMPVWNAQALAFVVGPQDFVPGTPGLKLGLTQDAPASLTWNTVIIDAQIRTPASPATFNIVVRKNGVTALTLPVTLAADTKLAIATSLAVVAGDDIEVYLVSTTGNLLPTYIGKLMVTVGRAVPWVLDTNLAAGTYRGYRLL